MNHLVLTKRRHKLLVRFALSSALEEWKDYYLKHELVHHWQYDTIGNIQMLFKPQWFVEGMAYALSDDPRGH